MQETQVRFLGQEDPLEKEMATHSNILAWEIPWTEAPGRLQSMGFQSGTQLNMHSCPQYPFVCVFGSSILPLMDAWVATPAVWVPVRPGGSVRIITWPSLPSFQLSWLEESYSVA